MATYSRESVAKAAREDQALARFKLREVEVESDCAFGPAMSALTERQRQFVLAKVLSVDGNDTSAAAAAGYSGNRDALAVAASRLNNHPKIQAAIQEEAELRLHGAKLLATRVLVDIASNVKEKGSDRLKAAGMILNRVGMSEKTEHHVVVDNRVTTQQLIRDITELARKTGMDPSKVLGSVGVAIDADFSVVSQLTGLEDIL